MKNQRARAFLSVGVVLLSVAGSARSADYMSMSGKELYGRFCAACHGVEAHGDGPVAASFKIQVPDLTLIAHRHRGTFSIESIQRFIDGRNVVNAHGTRAMPVWGEEFTRAEIGDPETERATHRMIARIAEFLAGIQQPDGN